MENERLKLYKYFVVSMSILEGDNLSNDEIDKIAIALQKELDML